MKDLCPACREIVEYEIDTDGEYCPLCGRTKLLAESVAANQKSKAIKHKIKFVFYTILILLFFMATIYMFNYHYERFEEAAIKGFAKGIVVFVIGIIGYAIYRLLKKIKMIS